MVDVIPFDGSVHREAYRQLNVELITWIADQFMAKYQLDGVSMIGHTVQEYVDAHLADFVSLRLPDGIIYLLVIEEDIAGMGAIRKLHEEIGEIKRMYIRPPYRGCGYGV
jgi:GNAT superfamily N-acetyltransferase